MIDSTGKDYDILMHDQAYQGLADYLDSLKTGALSAGAYLQAQLQGSDLGRLSIDAFLDCLLNTKQPQIFAESAVHGDGRDWNEHELKLLGAIGVAVPVAVYDDGRHHEPLPHVEPFTAHLLFSAGALLRNGQGQIPADWDVVGADGEIDPERYYRLYLHRLLPLLWHANALAGTAGKQAFITVPGLGCGQFAGKFIGRLGDNLKQVLLRLLSEHHTRLDNIRAVYFDPYNECDNERFEIGHLSFLTRPLTRGNQDKPQLCPPRRYQEPGDDFGKCRLFSIVAWDHVSWPGNDFYAGARATDDGVKAAATSSMTAMTGFKGRYDHATGTYKPLPPYRTWSEVVQNHGLRLEAAGRLRIMPPLDNDVRS